MLDYLCEIKNSRNNRALDHQPFNKEELKNLFNNEKEIGDYFKKRNIVPIEMESVHIETALKSEKKGLFSFLKKK